MLLTPSLLTHAQSTPESIGLAAGRNVPPTGQPADPSTAAPQLTFLVFLPVITTVELRAERLPPPVAEQCRLNANESAIANSMASDPNQNRPQLHCNSILAQVARARAEDMGRRGYFSHTTPEGYGPNHMVKQAGFVLPEWYDHSPGANNIESIAAGYNTAQKAWDAWMKSSRHREHLLAEDQFWAEQVEYGIGYAFVEGSPYLHYWVVLSAPAPVQ
jgi:uncharacterized protein YkwD